MAVQELIQSFLSSTHGREALDALKSKGVSGADAEAMLGHAAQAAHDHLREVSGAPGILGNQPGTHFAAGMAAGVLKGDGLTGSVGDGIEGLIGGRVAEYVATKAGVDSKVATTVAAAATPFLVGFLKNVLR